MKKFENKSFHKEDGLFGMVQLVGKVSFTGASDAATISGNGFSAVGTGTAGVYEITLDDKYAALHGAWFTVVKAGGAPHAVQLDSQTVAADGKLKVVVVDASLVAGQPSVSFDAQIFLALKA